MSYAFFEHKYPVQHEIPIKILDKTSFKAVVDTGSWSIFTYKQAQELGIDVVREAYHSYDSSFGEKFYLHKIPIKIGNTKPTIADIYFGSFKAYTWAPTEIAHIGWANNGGLNNYIMDYDINNISFTDFSFINSLPRPVNPFTIIKLSPPRLAPNLHDVILSNDRPYIDIKFKKGMVKMLIDTGSTHTLMKEKFSYLLSDKEIKSGKEVVTVRGTFKFYQHRLMAQIGTLPPRMLNIGFIKRGDILEYDKFPDALLGNDNMFAYYKIRFMKDRVMFQENPNSIWFKF